MTINVPVAPYVATFQGVDHVVLSLLGLAPTIHLTFPPVPSAGDPFSDVTLNILEMDLQGMVDLGFSGALTFASHTAYKSLFYVSDLAASWTIPNNVQESVITEAKFSVGLRFGIFAFNLDTHLEINAYTIAAQTTLNKASTAFQVIVLGVGLDAIAAIKPLFTSSVGSFTVETLQSIGAVQSGIANLLGSQTNSLTPVLASVYIDTAKLAQAVSDDIGQNLTDVITANAFAMERAWRKVVANDAVTQAKQHDVNDKIVNQAYDRILSLSGTQPVSQDKRQKALSGLVAGRF